MTPPRSLHIRVYWPSPGASLRMSFVRTEFRNSAAPAPLTVTSPICEMSKMPAALRTARCSLVMLVYCTGISQPPNSMSLPPSFWCAAKSEVRFNMILFHIGNTVSGADKRKIEFDSPDKFVLSKDSYPQPHQDFLRQHLVGRPAGTV